MLRARLIRYIARSLQAINSERYKGYPYITDSKIERLDLISKLAVIRNSELRGNISVSDNARIMDALLVGNVTIGRHTSFNGPNSDVWALVNRVQFGNFCSVARNVSIQEYDHHFDRLTSYFVHANVFGEKMANDIISKGDIAIGNDVWIGTQSVILSGAIISDGAVIGANSLVNCYIPPYAIAVGSPARVVKYRFPDPMIDRLLQIKWWNWDDERIRGNRAVFEDSLTEEKLNLIN